jgi:hypothetical protein
MTKSPLLIALAILAATSALADGPQDDQSNYAGGAQDLLGNTQVPKREDEATREGRDRNASATSPAITPLSGPGRVAPNVALPTSWQPTTR